MSYAKQLLIVNLDTRKVCKSATMRMTDPAAEGRIRLYDREMRVLCLTFVNGDGSAAAFPAGASYDFAVDYTRGAKAEAALMAFTDDAHINDLADWADADPTAGKIGVLVDCATDEFAAGLDTIDGEQTIWCQLRMFPSGETNHSTLLMDFGMAYSNVIGKYVS